MVPESMVSSLMTAVWVTFFISARSPLNLGAAWSMRAKTAATSSAAKAPELRRTAARIAPLQRFIRLPLRSGPGKRHVALQFTFRIEHRLDAGDRQVAVAGVVLQQTR